LADFQQPKPEFDALDAEIVALSADREEEAWEPEATSRAIGCYTGKHEGKPHIQPAAFILGSDGRIVHAMYSSGKVGRLTTGDALTMVKDLRK
jgi:peroxiredoxin